MPDETVNGNLTVTGTVYADNFRTAASGLLSIEKDNAKLNLSRSSNVTTASLSVATSGSIALVADNGETIASYRALAHRFYLGGSAQPFFIADNNRLEYVTSYYDKYSVTGDNEAGQIEVNAVTSGGAEAVLQSYAARHDFFVLGNHRAAFTSGLELYGGQGAASVSARSNSGGAAIPLVLNGSDVAVTAPFSAPSVLVFGQVSAGNLSTVGSIAAPGVLIQNQNIQANGWLASQSLSADQRIELRSIDGGGVRVRASNFANNALRPLDLEASVVRTPGWVSVGSGTQNYTPTGSTWATGGATLLLNGLDTTSIAFHDANNRVDAIVAGGGLMRVGPDTGFGPANVQTYGFTGAGGVPLANQRMRVYSSGDNSGHFPLAVVNSAGSAALMYVRGDGYAWTSQPWAVGSDERLKDKVEPLDATALEKLAQVTFHRYQLRANGLPQVGVIAQELQQVFPELVSEHHDPANPNEAPLLAVNYQGLAVYQGAAIQQLAAKVAGLEERLAALEKRFA
jgi:hypothetical protein